jgi:hypothetical protein
LQTSATILDHKDRTCVESEATFIVLSEAVAADAIGAPLTDEESTYLRYGEPGFRSVGCVNP